MFNTIALTKNEQEHRNIEERRAWERHVISIFMGLLAVFVVLTVAESAAGFWLLHFVHI